MSKMCHFSLKTQAAILSASETSEYSPYFSKRHLFSIEDTALQPKSAGTGGASSSGASAVLTFVFTYLEGLLGQMTAGSESSREVHMNIDEFTYRLRFVHVITHVYIEDITKY